MQEITRVGVDLAKAVIQVHAVDAAGKVVSAKAVTRAKFMAWCAQLPAGCLVAMEACGSAHHWGRKLTGLGLQTRLIAAHLVVPYRMQGKRGKNDANDAAAICEAASRPNMRFVPVKTLQQQGQLSVHTMREGFKQDRTACINRIRGVLAEFGLVAPQGPEALREVLAVMLEDADNDLPGLARMAIERAAQHWSQLDEHIAWCDQRIAAHVKDSERARQAMQLPGVGPITASALVASVGDFGQFASASQFGAWLGLTPSQNSSGGKARLGGITKRGDMYLRMLLIQGAKTAIRSCKNKEDPITRWAQALSERKGWQKAAVALANKNARILWAMFVRGTPFDAHHVSVKPV